MFKQKWRFFVLTILFSLTFTHLSAAQTNNAAKQKAKATAEQRIWNLKDVDIRTLIHEVANITGKNVVVAPNVNAKVTFISKHALTPDELYQAFLAVLRTHGYIAVPQGNVIKVLPEKNTDRIAGETLPGQPPKHGGEMTVTTLRVHNYPATDLVKVLKPLIPRYSYVEAYKPSNDLIIADHAENIAKLRELVRRLDKPTSDKLEMIRLLYANAEDLVKTLQDLFAGNTRAATRGGVSQLKLSADSRTNSVIMYGGTREDRLEVRATLAKLDVKYPSRGERIEVIYLHYIPAETIAPVLQGVVDSYMAEQEAKGEKVVKATTAATGTAAARRTRPRNTTSQFNLQRPLSNYNGSSSMVGANTRTGMAFETPRSGAVSANIQWEESTNSVILSAPADLIHKLKQVIAKLDIRRPQVLIEAVIAEVSMDQAKELGVEWSIRGTTQFNSRFPSIAPTTFISGTNQYASAIGGDGVLGAGFTFGFFRNNDLRALVRALHDDGRSNILATPNLVTLDNQEAQIKVGRKVSFAIGTIDNNPTGGNPFTSFDREDVGLVLTIKPQITPNGAIKLLIQQELSNLLPGTSNGGGNPDTSERYLNTTVMADNGHVLVLGGLLQRDWSDSTSKIPILGDIPVFGAAFRNHHKSLQKTNLMVFIRPIIMDTPEQADAVSGGKYEFLRQEQLHLLHPTRAKITSPVLPRTQSADLPSPFPCPVKKFPHEKGPCRIKRHYR